MLSNLQSTKPKRKKWTQAMFIEEAGKVHDGKYDYSLSVFLTINDKVEIICPLDGHGSFWQCAYNHLMRRGCPKCKYAYLSKRNCKTTVDFIQQATIVHGDTYDYSLVEYRGNDVKVKIICSSHGMFLQTPLNHLNGSGCKPCGYEFNKQSMMLTTEQFIERATAVHNGKYGYSKVQYIGGHDHVIITCSDHGDFEQLASTHLTGHGCPSCSHVVSRAENAWLDFLGIPPEYRQTTIMIGERFFKTDAYDPNTNTVYEFYGDFWHGNPQIYPPSKINIVNKKSFGELYADTAERERKIKQAGYGIVSIWERDWMEQNAK